MHLSKVIFIFAASIHFCSGIDQPVVLFVSERGEDATAGPGKMDKPFRTIGGARAIGKGKLIHVLPGVYTNDTALAEEEIYYSMLPGVTIDYTGKHFTNIIDDAGYPQGISVNIDGFADLANHSTFYDSVNHPALVLVTNPLSRLDIRCRDMLLRDSQTATIDIRNCSYVNIDAQIMSGPGHSTGIYWRDGSGIHIRAKEIRTGAYALWEDSSATNVVQDMFADIDYIETGGEGGLYVSGLNPNSALWVKSKVIKFNSATGLHLTGVSKFYASAQKFWVTVTNNGALFYVGNTGRFWGDGNKATSAGVPFLLTAAGGFVDLTIQQYEESGGKVSIGFDLSSATVSVHGGRMDVQGTCVKNTSGTNVLANMRLDSSRGTSSPIVVVGPGLTLQNCTLIAAPGIESVTATNGQTVKIIGTLTVNTTPSTNITFVGGRLIIDNSVSSNGPTPAIDLGPGAGPSSKVSITGNDVAGEIIITTGTLPSLGAVIATITYNSSPFALDSYPILSPANAAAGDLPYVPFAEGTTTNFSINSSGSLGLKPMTTYKYNYQVTGR